MVDLSFLVPISGAAALAFAVFLTWDVLRQPRGDAEMRRIADAVETGAKAFMRRQYRTIALLAVLIAALFAAALGLYSGLEVGLKTAGAFALGATFSAISGFVGLLVSVRANSRTAHHALTSFGRALTSALRGGAVSGLLIIALSLLGVWGIYHLYGGPSAPADQQGAIILSIVGFGFGASLVALFAQLGGGIYTKAADVGADLVGKVEAGIPEDDPRNPAVVADLVGDNVGDCAGRGADLFESTAAENIGAMVLGVALLPFFGINGVLFPLVARAMGLMATIVGVLVVAAREKDPPMRALNRGYYVTMGLATVLFAFTAWGMLSPTTLVAGLHPSTWFLFFLCGLVGILTSLAFVYITQYYTEGRFRPVREIADASQTGAATNIISGFSVGLLATAIPGLVIAAAILVSFYLGEATGLSSVIGGLPIPIGGLYGTAVATMGMLSTAAYVLAMDTFGPIADNAAGIVEMSGKGAEARTRMDRLDAAGNTTKALTKGYAVGSAALAAFLLFSAYLEVVRELRLAQGGEPLISVDLAVPAVFVGALVGVVLVFLFSALAIRAVGRAAVYIIQDVRDQLRANPRIMEGTESPDYARSVDICTRGALREMVAPGLLAVAGPVLVGVLLRPTGLAPEAVGAMLMVGTIAGVILALTLNTGGGAWDNAKKLIESGVHGGKGTETHKAAVVGDTVGDPFKDTAGPSLHILVKLLSTITLVLAPLFV